MFENSSVNLKILKQRSYNLRWATVPDGVIPLTAGDLDFPMAPEISNDIVNYVKEGYACYGPSEGLPAFKESVARFFREKRKVPALPRFTLPVDSAAFGIYLICKTFLKPEEEVIIFDPVDFLFRYSIETVGAVAVPFAIPPGDGAVDFQRLESLITSKTRLICLCNPLNPTGKVFSKEELCTLGEIAVKHKLTILSDEIWSDIVYAPCEFTSIASISEEIRERTVVVTGYSKSYGLAGLRIGAVLAFGEDHYQKLLDASLHRSTIHGANVIGQVAAISALEKCDVWLKDFVRHLTRMRDICVSALNEMPGVSCQLPEGCYVAFADIKGTGKSSQEIYELILAEAQVAVVPGLQEWFGEGAEGYIRLSFATSEDILKDALGRMHKALSRV